MTKVILRKRGIRKQLMYKVEIDPETADRLVATILREGLKYWRKDRKEAKYYERLTQAAEVVLKHFTV